MFRHFLPTIALAALSTRVLLAQSEPRVWTADEVQQIFKQRVDVEKQCVGIAVGIVNAQGNRVVGYGSLRKANPPIQPDQDTVFEIGSATKVFTTLLLADMVGREGGQLMLQATGQPKFQLFAESETEFFLKVVDAQITFVKSTSGDVTELILHQGGPTNLPKNEHVKTNDLESGDSTTCQHCCYAFAGPHSKHRSVEN